MLFGKNKQDKPQKAAPKGNAHYLTAKESREIARSNAKVIRALEKEKKRRIPEEE